VNINSTNI